MSSSEKMKDKRTHISGMWEGWNEDIKSIAIQRSTSILHESRFRNVVLERNSKHWCREECDNRGAGIQDIDYVKALLNELPMQRYRGIILRSRAGGYSLGKQPTKIALVREHIYALVKEINCIHSGPFITYEKDVIHDVFPRHYSFLFRTKRPLINLNNIHGMLTNIPTLPVYNR